jgi:hypothetical protein
MILNKLFYICASLKQKRLIMKRLGARKKAPEKRMQQFYSSLQAFKCKQLGDIGDKAREMLERAYLLSLENDKYFEIILATLDKLIEDAKKLNK